MNDQKAKVPKPWIYKTSEEELLGFEMGGDHPTRLFGHRVDYGMLDDQILRGLAEDRLRATYFAWALATGPRSLQIVDKAKQEGRYFTDQEEHALRRLLRAPEPHTHQSIKDLNHLVFGIKHPGTK